VRFISSLFPLRRRWFFNKKTAFAKRTSKRRYSSKGIHNLPQISGVFSLKAFPHLAALGMWVMWGDWTDS